ncbi:MAG TPA: PLP-dependent aminotransferase family protein [Micromonosporaceae bacterium]|nr:PLP-dependent aminotransferase family protein [Micromonosporaceae bacterium]
MSRGLPVVQFEERPGILDLSWGHPSPSLLPVEAWSVAAQTALSRHRADALSYGADPGPGPLREWIAARLSDIDSGGSTPDGIFVTGGASHALALVCNVLAEPGDVVLVDSPTYHLALPILRDHGVDLVGVPADGDGVDVTATETMVSRLRGTGRRVRLLYIVPTFGNPTGGCLPEQRRVALVDLAMRAGLTIVEDDTYREVVYEGVAPPSLWRLANGSAGSAAPSEVDAVVRLGSFAKTVAPGVRLGWIQASAAFVTRVARIGYVHSGGGVNHAAALTMADFGASGAYDRHLAEVRQRYAARRDALVTALRDTVRPDVPLPQGGWFVWLTLPAGVPANDLLPLAEQRGVSFTPGTQFYANGSSGDDHVRLSYSMLSPTELADAAGRLASAIAAASTL